MGLQILPGHMSVAVKTRAISGTTNPYGYLYGETTAMNYKIGNIPEKMKSAFIDDSYYPAGRSLWRSSDRGIRSFGRLCKAECIVLTCFSARFRLALNDLYQNRRHVRIRL